MLVMVAFGGTALTAVDSVGHVIIDPVYRVGTSKSFRLTGLMVASVLVAGCGQLTERTGTPGRSHHVCD
jgi:hypothetical protein